MEPMTAIMLMGAVQAAGGLLNYAIQQGYNEQQMAAFKRLYDQAEAIAVPNLQAPEYQQYREVSPYQIESYSPNLLPGTEEGSMALDEDTRGRQMQVLDEIQRIYQEGGLDPQSVAAMNEAQMQTNQNMQAQRAGIQAQAARSGRGGTALDYLMQQQAGQDDANRLNQASLNAAASARQRALQSMGMFAEQASNLRNQDFGQQQQIARAKDIYSKFNTNMMNDALRYQVEQENARNKNMFENKQNIANANVDLINKSMENRNTIAQRNYQNQLDKLKTMSGAQGGVSAAGRENVNDLGKGIGDFSSGIAQGLGSYAQYSQQQKLLDQINRTPRVEGRDNYPTPKVPNTQDDDLSDIYDYYGQRKTYA